MNTNINLPIMLTECSQIKKEYEALMKQAAGFAPVVEGVAEKKGDFSEAKKRLKELAAAYDSLLEKVDRYDLILRKRIFAKLKKNGVTFVEKFHEGMAVVKFEGDEESDWQDSYSYVNRAGKIVGGKYIEAWPFSSGRAFVRGEDDSRYQMIDKSGCRIGNGSYFTVTDFVDGLAKVRYHDDVLVSLVGTNGERVGDGYADIGSFCDGLASVKYAVTGECRYINKKGQSNGKRYGQAKDFFHGHAAVGDFHGFWFIDRDGEPIVPQEIYSRVYDPVDGMTRVVQNRMFYFLDENLKKIGGPYAFAEDFSCGVAWANQGGGYYLIDKRGVRVSGEQIYSHITPFRAGYGMAETDEGWIFVDKQGQRVGKECLSRSLLFHASGFAVSPVGRKFYVYHASGRKVSDTPFSSMLDFHQGRCFVTEAPSGVGDYYVIDEQGNHINDEKYFQVNSFRDAVASVILNGNNAYIDLQGKRIFEK